MTLIAKATYILKPGQPPIPLPKQPFPTGDEFYPDDEEKSGPPRYESDFAYFKPKADLLLVGTCHPPGGKPIPVCQATFQVGNKTGKLTVAGDRRWEKKLLSRSATAPQPFRSMAMRYENSYGGPGYVANPIGKGHEPLRGGQGQEIWQLPNIENPAQLIQNPKDRPFPAGFAPLSAKWHTRAGKLGSYGGSYRKTRWPWFPVDFDFSYFNAAAPDMQVEGFLRGDEPLLFENLHPEHAKYESRLPGVRGIFDIGQLPDFLPLSAAQWLMALADWVGDIAGAAVTIFITQRHETKRLRSGGSTAKELFFPATIPGDGQFTRLVADLEYRLTHGNRFTARRMAGAN